jgi:parvulin-like peptidyl-prolyl isomerase
VDIATLDLKRTLDSLYNDAYAVYKTAAGVSLRTATNPDAFSIQRFGHTRRAAVPTETTISQIAQASRDGFIGDNKDPRPQATIVITELYNSSGQRAPLWSLRAEEGILQIKNRFKARTPGTKPTKEEFERPLTAKENEEFQKELRSQNLTEKDFEKKIEGQLKVLNLTDQEVKRRVPAPFKDTGTADDENRQLTPDYEKETKELYSQIEKKYNDKNFTPNPDDELDQMVQLLKSRLGETVHARHILVKSDRTDDMKKRAAALEKIKSIKSELDAGADFEELAKKKSDGPGATTGGDLGFFTKGQMVPEFDKAAFELPVGGTSGVIETKFGYHILRVEEKRAAQKLRYDDIKFDLANYIYQKRGQERYDEFVRELRNKADVKILHDVDAVKKG